MALPVTGRPSRSREPGSLPPPVRTLVDVPSGTRELLDDPPPTTMPPGADRYAAEPVRSPLDDDELERGVDVVLELGMRLYVRGAGSDGVRPTLLGAVDDDELPDDDEPPPDSPDEELLDEDEPDEPELDPDDVVLPRGTA
jgi:hypothetical protein